MRKYQNYMGKYNSRIILMGLFVFLFHGAKLFSDSIGIDTEDLIHLGNDFYDGWFTMGRQGLVFLKALLGSLRFNPYFAELATLVFLAAGGGSFFLLWDGTVRQDQKKDFLEKNFAGWFFGGLLLFSHPILTEQLYFTLQGAEICLGFCLTAAALYFSEKWVRSGGIFPFLAGVLLLGVTFSSYQVFTALYIFGAVSVLLLRGLAGGEEGKTKRLVRRMLSHIGVFLTAFLINMAVTQLFFSGSSYLQRQILWGKAPLADVVKSVFAHVFQVFTGYDFIYYSAGYGILCVTAAVLFFALLFKKGYGRKEKLLLTFYLSALFMAPFLMTLVCGGAPVVRSQLVLPVITGFFGWFTVYLKKSLDELGIQEKQEESASKKAGWIFCAFLCLLTGAAQLQTTMRLYYTDSVRYEQDVSTAREIIYEIENVRGNELLPVVFIGKREFEKNNACIDGETIGRSFFAHDTSEEPAFYWSSRRILGFFHTLGKNYPLVSKDRIPEAVEYSRYMPQWPAKNSVQAYEGMIVVKLSHYE